jgi:hypothetical protein
MSPARPRASPIQIREGDHRPSLDAVLPRKGVRAAGEQTSLVFELCTGGSVDDSLEKPLTLQDAGPDPRSLAWGTTNVGDDVVVLISPPVHGPALRACLQARWDRRAQRIHTTQDPPSRVRQVTEQAAASRGLHSALEPAHADIVDPFGREEEVFATMAQQITRPIPAVVHVPGR